MDSSTEPRKPLIVSQLSAEILSRRLQKVQSQNIIDGDGLTWNLRVIQHQKADPQDPDSLLWILMMSLHVEASPEELLKTGTLNLPDDERILELLRQGSDPVGIYLKPCRIEAPDESSLLKKARQIMPDYLGKVSGKSLHQMKRQIIFRLIEKRCQFGSGI